MYKRKPDEEKPTKKLAKPGELHKESGKKLQNISKEIDMMNVYARNNGKIRYFSFSRAQISFVIHVFKFRARVECNGCRCGIVELFRIAQCNNVPKL